MCFNYDTRTNSAHKTAHISSRIGAYHLGASFSYYAFGAARGTSLAIFHTILIFLAVVTAQIVANLWNEYKDFKSGLDAGQKVGNAGSITRGAITPELIVTMIKSTHGGANHHWRLLIRYHHMVLRSSRLRMYSYQFPLLWWSETNFSYALWGNLFWRRHGPCHRTHYGIRLDS